MTRCIEVGGDLGEGILGYNSWRKCCVIYSIVVLQVLPIAGRAWHVDNLLEDQLSSSLKDTPQGHRSIFLHESIWIHLSPLTNCFPHRFLQLRLPNFSQKLSPMERPAWVVSEGFSFSQIRFLLSFKTQLKVEDGSSAFFGISNSFFKNRCNRSEFQLQRGRHKRMLHWSHEIENFEQGALLLACSFFRNTCLNFPNMFSHCTFSMDVKGKEPFWRNLIDWNYNILYYKFIFFTDSSHIKLHVVSPNSTSIQKHTFFDAATWQDHCSDFENGVQLMDAFIYPKTVQGTCILTPEFPFQNKQKSWPGPGSFFGV